MIIEFKQDSEIEVVESYDEENDVAETSDVRFKAGEQVDVDVLNEREDTIDVQFGDGSCCYGLLRSCFIVLPCPNYEAGVTCDCTYCLNQLAVPE